MGTATHTLENYIALAMPALTEIPGFTALAKADGQDYDALAAKYPDAVFALMIANNLFHHNRNHTAGVLLHYGWHGHSICTPPI